MTCCSTLGAASGRAPPPGLTRVVPRQVGVQGGGVKRVVGTPYACAGAGRGQARTNWEAAATAANAAMMQRSSRTGSWGELVQRGVLPHLAVAAWRHRQQCRCQLRGPSRWPPPVQPPSASKPSRDGGRRAVDGDTSAAATVVGSSKKAGVTHLGMLGEGAAPTAPQSSPPWRRRRGRHGLPWRGVPHCRRCWRSWCGAAAPCQRVRRAQRRLERCWQRRRCWVPASAVPARRRCRRRGLPQPL